MATGKRSDPAAIRRQQQKIAEDVVRRETIRSQGDTVTPRRPASSPVKPKPMVRPQRMNPTRSQGIVIGYRKTPTDA